MAVTTTGNLTAEMKSYYDLAFLEKLDQNTVYASVAEFKNLPKNQGNSIVWTRYIQPAAANPTALTEGVNPTGQAVSAENVSTTINEYGAFWNVSSKVAMTAIDPDLEKAVDVASQDAKNSIDQAVINELGNLSTYNTASQIKYANAKAFVSTTGATDILSIKEVRRARATLEKGKASTFDDGFFHAVIHPDTEYDLQGDSSYISIYQYGKPDQIYNGQSGKMFGVQFYVSNNGSIASASGGASSAKIFDNFFFGKGAIATCGLGKTVTGNDDYGIIVKKSGPQDTSNPLNMFYTFGWKIPWAVKILQYNYLVDIRTGTSFV